MVVKMRPTQDLCEVLELLLMFIEQRDRPEDTVGDRRAIHRLGHRQDVVLDRWREAKQAQNVGHPSSCDTLAAGDSLTKNGLMLRD